MSSLFLPTGLVLAFVISWLIPEPGKLLQGVGLIPWMVIIIFLVNGYQTQLHQISLKGTIWKTIGVAILINLLISPLLGLGATMLLALPVGAAIGLIVTATVPSTLSSGIVMTQLAGGDGVKALLLTIILNLLGVFTIPFMLQLLMSQAGGIEISAWPLLKTLVLIVLIPFIIGMASRYFFSLSKKNKLLVYLPSSCVIATVWMSVSTSSDTLRELSPRLLIYIAIGSILLHGALLLLCWISRYLVPTERGEWLALLFTASQKTLPVSVGVLAALNQPIGIALVVCVLFHFLQLFVDALIAAQFAKQVEVKTS